jgi:hypothetical protein
MTMKAAVRATTQLLAVGIVTAASLAACSSDNDPFVKPKATGGAPSKDAGASGSSSIGGSTSTGGSNARDSGTPPNDATADAN